MSELAIILIVLLGVGPALAALAIGLIVVLDDANAPGWIALPLVYLTVVGVALGASYGLVALQ